MGDLVERPAFIVLEMANGTRITGIQQRYSDPDELSAFGPFVMEDSDGTKTYVHGAAILRLVVYPLDGPASAAAILQAAEEEGEHE